MKLIKNIILIILSIFVFTTSFAQKQKTKPINSGFVFIDGKYIEPPYKIMSKNGSLFINGILVSKKTDWKRIKKEKKELKNSRSTLTKPPVPPNLAINSSLNDINKLKYLQSDITYTGAAYNYFYKTCSFDDAIDSIANYYRSLPNIKEFYRTKENSSVWYMEAYNGENRKFLLGSTISKNKYKRINKLNNMSVDSLKKQMTFAMNSNMEDIKYELINNKIIFFFPEKDIKSYINVLKYSINDFLFIHNIILKKNLSKPQKENIIRDHFNYNSQYYTTLIKEIIDKYEINTVFVEKMKKYINKEKTEIINYQKKSEDKIFDGSAYSPKKTLKGWCPNEYELAFNMFHTQEIQNIKSYISNQDFIWNNYNDIYIDNSSSDDDGGNNINYGECSYQNFCDMKNAGIIYIATHGLDNGGGILIRFMTSEIIANNWHNDNMNMYEVELNPFDVDSWDNSTDLWAVVATKEWFINNWKQDLTDNNAIVIFSVCYGANYGYIDAYGGGATFAYSELSSWNDYDFYDNPIPNTGIEYNNKELFKRMNGEIDDGEQREVQEAYNGINNKYFGFSLNTNSDITLCPAPLKEDDEPFSPKQDEEVASTGSGYIKFDTWCDASKDVYSAISVTDASGNILTYAEWDTPTKSKQLNFTWSGGSDVATVTLNPNYIVSYGGGEHKLDFSRTTPNGEIGSYNFIIDESIPTGPPYADFNYSINANQVNFVDQSTQTPTDWEWDFGDGTTLDNQNNVSHTFPGNGSYNVSLTVSNDIFPQSSTKTRTIVITGTSSDYLISGRVFDNDHVSTGINDAIVTFTGTNGSPSYTTTTHANNYGNIGYYEKTVAAGWKGVITASKSGWSLVGSGINKENGNGIYSDNTGNYLYLDEHDNVYFTYGNINSCSAVLFTSHNIPQNSNLIWKVNGLEMQNNFLPTANLNLGNGYNTVELEVYTNGMFYGNYNENFNDVECNYLLEPNMQASCEVADLGQSIHFYETSIISDEAKQDEQRRWVFDTEYTTDLYNFDDRPNPLNTTQSFSTTGKKIIKLEYWSITKYWDWDCFCKKIVEDYTAYGGINVVDCDYTSQFYSYEYGLINGFTNTSVDYWGHDNWNGPINIYGGSFEFNGEANNLLNSDKYELSACNEIVINGDVEFIADGSNELILTSGEIPNCQDTYLSNYNQPENNNEQLDLDIDNTLKATVYPNPFTKNFNIEIEVENNQNISIEISDIDGKIINTYNKNINSGINTLPINANNLDKGIYFVKITATENSRVFKIVKTID